MMLRGASRWLTHGGMRWLITGLCVLASATASHSSAIPRMSAPSRRSVVTYFVDKNVQGQIVTEWRVFDPATGVDTLFGALSARSVYWDTTESIAEYISGDQLFRVSWEHGAQPWPLLRLPNYDVRDWWLDAVTKTWRAMVVRGVSCEHASSQRSPWCCRAEMWHSNRSGSSWQLARAETTDCEDSHTYSGGWRVADPPGTCRSPAIGLRQLQDAMSLDAWGGKPEPIPPPRGEVSGGAPWVYVPFRTSLGRGLAFRLRRSPRGITTLAAPLYLIDRSRGTQQLLDTPFMRRDEEAWQLGFEEQEGYLLLSGTRTYLFDLRTGAQILPQPCCSVRQAVWIKPLAPASVDTLGLQRLRERFR